MARGKGDGGLYKDSRGLWTAVVELPPSFDGKRRRKVIRRKNKKKALDELNQLKATIAIYGDAVTGGRTVKDWVEYWLESILANKAAPTTYRSYERSARVYIVPMLGKVKLSKVTARHVRDFHAQLAKIPVDKALREKPESQWGAGYKRLTANTIKSAHSALSKMLADAVTEGWILSNPAKIVGAPKVGEKARTIEALSLPMVKRLLAYIATRPDGALWATYLLTGLRRGEVLGLELDRINFDKRTLDASWQLQRISEDHIAKASEDYEVRHMHRTLYLTRPKSKSGWRVIPLVEPLYSILKLHAQGRGPGLLFTREDGGPLNPDKVGDEWHDLLANAKIESGATLHGARHTIVDLLYDAGVSEGVIQQIVGHSTIAMTRSYKTRGNPEQAKKALESLNELLK